MALKLYYSVGSPPSRGVLLLIRTLKLDVEVITLNLGAGEQMTEDFLKLNPLHQVPVLVDGDFVLSESRAIMGYLVNKYSPGSTLYPTDPALRAVVDQRLYYDATVVFESIATIIRTVLYKGAQKIPTEMREKLTNTLAVLESFLFTNKWFAGNNMTLADFSILPSITTVKALGYDLRQHPKRMNGTSGVNHCRASKLTLPARKT